MHIRDRSLIHMTIMTLITCGLYLIYWAVVTKNDLNYLGAHIPTAWLLIIPFANFYFWYKYAQAFAHYIRKNDDDALIYFVIIIFLPLIGKLIIQHEFNKYVRYQPL